MDTALVLYESRLRTITDDCADPWFAEQLVTFRSGDEMAWRRISGSCLARVLEIAKQKHHPECPIAFLDIVQEANRVLAQTIRRFNGSTASEFLCELTNQVEGRLTVIVEHPDLLG